MVEIAELFREALRVGPLVAALAVAVYVLWRKLEQKDARVIELTREFLTAAASLRQAVEDNTETVASLRDAIERGEQRGAYRPRGTGGD